MCVIMRLHMPLHLCACLYIYIYTQSVCVCVSLGCGCVCHTYRHDEVTATLITGIAGDEASCFTGGCEHTLHIIARVQDWPNSTVIRLNLCCWFITTKNGIYTYTHIHTHTQVSFSPIERVDDTYIRRWCSWRIDARKHRQQYWMPLETNVQCRHWYRVLLQVVVEMAAKESLHHDSMLSNKKQKRWWWTHTL